MIAPIEQVGGKKARLKNEIVPIPDRATAENVLLDLAEVINEQRAVNARMDAEKLAVTAKYQGELALRELQVTNMLARLENYATTHPEIFPAKRKSVEWPAGKFGFRTDTPSLGLAKRTFGWAQIVAVIAARRLRKFIRIKTEVDKDAILARCGTLEQPTRFQLRTLPALGLKLVQEERFYVEPDLTKTGVQS